MKKLNKKFESNAVSLSAYYTCMCNRLPCPCNDMRAPDGPMKSATEATYEEIKYQENVSWNN